MTRMSEFKSGNPSSNGIGLLLANVECKIAVEYQWCHVSDLRRTVTVEQLTTTQRQSRFFHANVQVGELCPLYLYSLLVPCNLYEMFLASICPERLTKRKR